MAHIGKEARFNEETRPGNKHVNGQKNLILMHEENGKVHAKLKHHSSSTVQLRGSSISCGNTEPPMIMPVMIIRDGIRDRVLGDE